MNLKFDLPQVQEYAISGALMGETIEYCVPYDINERHSFVNGWAVITKSHFFVIEDEELLVSYDLSKCSDFKAEKDIASGRLEATVDGNDIILLHFTMEHFARYMYIATILGSLSQGKIPNIAIKDDETKCPNCGRILLRGTRLCLSCTNSLSVIKRIFIIARKNWWLYAILLLLFFSSSGVMLLTPRINRALIDNVLMPGNKNLLLLLTYVGAMAICGLLSVGISVATGFVTTQASATLSKNLKSLVYSKIQELSMGYIEGKQTGDLMNRINGDTQRIQRFIQDIAARGFNDIVLLVAVSVIMFFYNWRLALLVVIPVPFVLAYSNSIRQKIRKMYRNQWRRMDKLDSLLNDVLKGIRVVKAFGQEEREIGRFTESAKVYRDITARNEGFFYTAFPIMRFVLGIGNFFILYVGGKMILGQLDGVTLQVGEFVQFTTYASYVYGRLEWLSALPRWLNETAISAQRIFEVIDEQPEVLDCTDCDNKEIKGQVSMNHVTFGYQYYEPVLKDINVEFKAGEMIGLVGHSGAGKSTIINLLMRLYDTDDGNVTVDGENIKRFSQQYYKSQIGVVLQETFLFSGTILQNLAYAKPDATVDEIITAAKIANAHDFISAFPNGYDTYVGEKGHRLSGGERQRIAIARAILSNPKILILDEATASVDTETEQQIQEALRRVIKNRTTFAIAHRLSTLKNADRILVMDHGKMAELGTHKELMEKKGIYHGLVMAQMEMSRIKTI